MQPRNLLAAAAVAAVAAAAALSLYSAPAAAAPRHATPRSTTTEMEVFSPDGTMTRAPVRRPVSDSAPASLAAVAADVVPIEVNGPSASQLDLVFVGDGYTSGQLATYGQHVRSRVAELFAVEPFRTHRAQFNVWQVNVVSAQSGVDNDPTRGVLRSTALDMYFWCGGIERLLCVNSTKARQFAASAPDADQIVALANATKYGGAGGGVATSSGGNASAGQIVVHELGHSVGGLADEYDYGTCNRQEPREPNATTYTAAQLRSFQYKWYAKLGQATPDGGTIGTYVGARYCPSGMYRPSQNSIMRTLGRPFNLVGSDAMVAAFYRER